jgi:pimeloyl-ACP methyl ester carboxylesterase
MKRMLALVFLTVVLGYAALCVFIFMIQRQLLYHPPAKPDGEQRALAAGAGLEPWRDATGARIGWKRERPGGAADQRWLVLHGNAGLAVHRAYWADALERVSPGRTLSIHVLEYPGYGDRAGSPTQQAITAAALAGLDHLSADGQRTHLLGESLGCAVAAQIAVARPERVGGLVLVSPFNRLADVAAHHYPWLPVRHLLLDPWRSDEALHGFSGPVAILAAEHDGVVPAKFARRLHDALSGRKRLHIVAGEDHNFFVSDQPWFRDAVAFATGE